MAEVEALNVDDADENLGAELVLGAAGVVSAVVTTGIFSVSAIST